MTTKVKLQVTLTVDADNSAEGKLLIKNIKAGVEEALLNHGIEHRRYISTVRVTSVDMPAEEQPRKHRRPVRKEA